MKRFFISFGFKRIICVIFGVLFVSLNFFAQNLPEDAPILISQPGSTRALTNYAPRTKSELPRTVFPSGAKTLITLFITNVELLPDEGAKAFRADAEDARRVRYPLEIVSLEQLRDKPWVYALTVRLNNRLGDVGDVLVRVNWRGM